MIKGRVERIRNKEKEENETATSRHQREWEPNNKNTLRGKGINEKMINAE